MTTTQLDRRSEWTLEVILVLTTLALACLLYYADTAQIVVLNLFYLPIVLAGFFLGRYRAGVMALLSVVTATMVIAMDMSRFATAQAPVVIALSIMVWGAVLGLTSILVGTLSDDRAARSIEAHEAHVGVVEVLSRYLQSAHPALQSRAMRVVQLAEQVAARLRLPHKEIDDIRVAAMLLDMEHIEITARVIRKAVGQMEESGEVHEPKTVPGSELVRSLGSVLSGAFPLLLAQVEYSRKSRAEIPLGARILHTVRGFTELTTPHWSGQQLDPLEAIDEMRIDVDAAHDPTVLFVLEELIAAENKGLPTNPPNVGSVPTAS